MKNFRACLILGLLMTLPSLGYSKNPPCVQWYSSCQKNLLYTTDGYGDAGKSKLYQLRVDYELLNEDGSVTSSYTSTNRTIQTFGPLGYIVVGIPNFFYAVSGRAELASACRQLKNSVRSASCH